MDEHIIYIIAYNNSLRTTLCQAKNSMLSILNNAKFIRCSENNCRCRLLVPLNGFYCDIDKKYDIFADALIETIICSFVDHRDSNMPELFKIEESKHTHGLITFAKEQTDIMKLSHSGEGHFGRTKSPLAVSKYRV